MVKTLILSLLLAMSAPAFSATYYMSNSGNDSTGDGSSGNPWQTFNKAFRTGMSSGDTLILEDGTYTGDNNKFDQGWPRNMPFGTVGAWTTLKAEHPGKAILDGQGVRDMVYLDYQAQSKQDAYWIFDGIVVSSTTHNNWGFYNMTHIKMFNCGGVDAAAGNNVNFAFGQGCEDYLVERCYAWGRGRYKFLGGGTKRGIFRQCVARHDLENPSEVLATFTIYGSTNVYMFNCIDVDSDQFSKWTNVAEWGGSFFMPSTSGNVEDSQFSGCIALNTKLPGGQFTGNQYYAAIRSSITNSVLWNTWVSSGDATYAGPYSWMQMRGSSDTISNCTMGIAHQDGAIPIFNSSNNYPTSSTDNASLLKNSIVYGFYGTSEMQDGTESTHRIKKQDYNCYYGNANLTGVSGANNITNNSPIWSVANSSGALKYIPRIESGSSLSGKGEGGADIGATILYQIGVSSSMYGETDWNTVGTTHLWPWINEGAVKDAFSTYNNGGVSGARGFCIGNSIDSTPQTLTKYIWEYLGNQIPADIYGTVSSTNTHYVATTGSNAADGSSATPWQTIQYGCDHMGPGDTLIVRDGTYTAITAQVVEVFVGGTPSSYTNIKAENKWGAVIDCRNNLNGYGVVVSTSYVTLDGFEIKGSSQILIVDDTQSDSNIGLNIINCKIHDAGTGLNTNQSDGIDGIYLSMSGIANISNNQIYNIGRSTGQSNYGYHDHGIYISKASTITIINNLIKDTSAGWCIQVAGLAGVMNSSITISNNVFDSRNANKQGNFLIDSKNVSNMTVENNISYNPWGFMVKLYQYAPINWSGIKVRNNIIYNANQGEGDASITYSNNKENTNPLFVGQPTMNYHLSNGSPAIGAGYANGLALDYDGVARSNPPAIGAYEYVAGAVQCDTATISVAPSSGTTSTTFTFTGTLTSTATSNASWAWNFGDTGTASTMTVTHQYGAAGTYPVTMTAYDANGNFGSTMTYVTVGVAVTTVTMTITPVTGLTPLTVTATISYTDLPYGATLFSIDGGDGVTGNGGAATGFTASYPTTFTYATAGSWNARGYVQDSHGTKYYTDYVTVNPGKAGIVMRGLVLRGLKN